jgi:hypothetical protein
VLREILSLCVFVTAVIFRISDVCVVFSAEFLGSFSVFERRRGRVGVCVYYCRT